MLEYHLINVYHLFWFTNIDRFLALSSLISSLFIPKNWPLSHIDINSFHSVTDVIIGLLQNRQLIMGFSVTGGATVTTGYQGSDCADRHKSRHVGNVMLSCKHFTSSSNSDKVCGVGALVKYASPDITSYKMKHESLSTLMTSLLWNVPAAGSYRGIFLRQLFDSIVKAQTFIHSFSKGSSSFILCNLCLWDLLCTWWFLSCLTADCRWLWCNTWCQRTHLSTPPKTSDNYSRDKGGSSSHGAHYMWDSTGDRLHGNMLWTTLVLVSGLLILIILYSTRRR